MKKLVLFYFICLFYFYIPTISLSSSCSKVMQQFIRRNREQDYLITILSEVEDRFESCNTKQA